MASNNTITHIEIPAPDLQLAIAFYTRIFNWKIEVVTENEYAYFMIGETNTGGGLDASLLPALEKQGPQIVIDVDNIELTLADIEAAGGFKTKEKTEIPGGHGHYACFRDPNGNNLQIHSGE